MGGYISKTMGLNNRRALSPFIVLNLSLRHQLEKGFFRIAPDGILDRKAWVSNDHNDYFCPNYSFFPHELYTVEA